MDRFDLSDGEVVGALVRPARAKEQRCHGNVDERSWVTRPPIS